jgi:hypothetical protein
MDTRIVTATGDTDWDWPCLHCRAEELVEARVTWTNEAGTVVDLPSDDVSASTSAADATVQVKYVPGEASPNLTVTDNTGVLDGNTLVLSNMNMSAMSGCYRAAMRLIDGSGNIHFSLPFLISVERDMFTTGIAKAVTIADIRMFMYDRTATENVVEGKQEFPDRLLFDSLCQAVRFYNQHPPGHSKNVRTFTEHGPLLEGVAGFAYGSYAALLARNRLQVPGQADAEQRLAVYTELARLYKSRYLTWISEHKRILDAGDGWGLA